VLGCGDVLRALIEMTRTGFVYLHHLLLHSIHRASVPLLALLTRAYTSIHTHTQPKVTAVSPSAGKKRPRARSEVVPETTLKVYVCM
jgi:hypothetical protein